MNSNDSKERSMNDWPEPTEDEIERGYADHLARLRGEDEPPPEVLEQLERRKAALDVLKDRFGGVQLHAARMTALGSRRKVRGKRADSAAAPRTRASGPSGSVKPQSGPQGGVA